MRAVRAEMKVYQEKIRFIAVIRCQVLIPQEFPAANAELRSGCDFQRDSLVPRDPGI